MTREQAFEHQLADWLEDGPFAAPDRAVDDAVAYARAHPRRRPLVVGPWRAVITRLNLTGAQPRSAHRLSLAAVAAAVVVVVGAGGAYLVANRPSSAPAAAVASPSTTAGPTASLGSSAVPVSGRQTCVTTVAGTAITIGGVTRSRGILLTCSEQASDPRLDGTVRFRLSLDARVDGSADLWGTATLTNTGGAWTGPLRGTVAAGSTARAIDGLLVGSREYGGLRVRYHLVADGDRQELAGTIEPRDLTVPDGSLVVMSCGDTTIVDEGTTTTDSDATRSRGTVWTCPTLAGDPRLVGVSQVTHNMDERSDGSATIWGTNVISGNPGTWMGHWTGDWSGTIDAGESTHHITATLIGSGYWGGLQVDMTTVGTADTLLVTVARIVPAAGSATATPEPRAASTPLVVASPSIPGAMAWRGWATCRVTDPGTASEVIAIRSGVSATATSLSGRTLACEVETTDRRSSGTLTIRLDRIPAFTWPNGNPYTVGQWDGTYTYTGAARFEHPPEPGPLGAPGAWSLVLDGVSAADEADVSLTLRGVGLGNFAGLAYSATLTIRADLSAKIVGAFIP